MKHIVYCIGDLTTPGGIGRIVSLKANWLADHGYKVSVLLSEGTEDTPLFYELDRRIKTVYLNINFLTVYGNSTGILGVIKSYIDRVKKEKKFIFKLNEWLKCNPADVLFTTNNSAGIAKLKDNSKKVFEFHFSPQAKAEFKKELPLVSRWLYSLYDNRQRKNYRYFDKVVCLTQRGMQYYDNPNNFVVIPNFISIELPKSFSNCHAKRAISVGRLSSAKGFDYLIKAWAGVHRQYPEWVCDIYGYGYGRENEYQQLIDENGLRNVVVIHEPVRNISEKYAAASFYVMTSRNEGFPLVLPEAMACGLPVVSFNCNSGPSEIITDGVDGILVNQVGDIPAMTFAICRMIKDEEMRIWMGKNALRNVQRYSQEKIMTEWVKLIESL